MQVEREPVAWFEPHPAALRRLQAMLLGDEPYVRLEPDAIVLAAQHLQHRLDGSGVALMTDPDWEALARDRRTAHNFRRALASLAARRRWLVRRDGVSEETREMAERVAEILARNGWQVDAARGASIVCMRDRPVALEAAEALPHGIHVAVRESLARAWPAGRPDTSLEQLVGYVTGREPEPQPPERPAIVHASTRAEWTSLGMPGTEPLRGTISDSGLVLWAAPDGSVVELGTPTMLWPAHFEHRDPRVYR